MVLLLKTFINLKRIHKATLNTTIIDLQIPKHIPVPGFISVILYPPYSLCSMTSIILQIHITDFPRVFFPDLSSLTFIQIICLLSCVIHAHISVTVFTVNLALNGIFIIFSFLHFSLCKILKILLTIEEITFILNLVNI